MSRAYRIMIADDEGIVIESLQFIVEKLFPGKCEIQTAKTGRAVIEVTEEFRPDIIFMDIQMPGINGLDAMKEIRQFNAEVIFIVLSAYDKFDYAKEAIGLGVLEYLNKPFSYEMIRTVLQKAFHQIDSARNKRKQELFIKEKMEIATPFIESSFIYSILFHECNMLEKSKYKEMLNIELDHVYAAIITTDEWQEEYKEVDASDLQLRMQHAYLKIREIIKENLECIVGPVLSNKIICIVPILPESTVSDEYNTRVSTIEKYRLLAEKLFEKCNLHLRFGIGSIQSFRTIEDSYQEALEALQKSTAEVIHVGDLSLGCEYDKDYPITDEKKIFEAEKNGEVTAVLEAGERFFNWMKEYYPTCIMDIKLKCLEFVLWAEHEAYISGGMVYHFKSRTEYLPQIMEMEQLEEIEKWFLNKLSEATCHVVVKREKTVDSLIECAVKYIQLHYNRDISLDEVSEYVDISPYYFSRLFKEEMQCTFIEYLTTIRMERAKNMIADSAFSMKEICSGIGYTDPNYFSRIFKKCTGYTPTEYKEAISQKG